MNAVMRLNQYRPGLEYRLTSQTGPVHEPVFTMAVDLNGKTYEATGPSKRAAKLNVATKERFVYFYLYKLPLISFIIKASLLSSLLGSSLICYPDKIIFDFFVGLSYCCSLLIGSLAQFVFDKPTVNSSVTSTYLCSAVCV